MLINSEGQIQRCSTYGSMILGMYLEENEFYECVKVYKSLGFLEIESAGSIGIACSFDSIFTVTQIIANSSAATSQIGIGDKLVSIDDTNIKSIYDFNKSIFGEVGSTVKLKLTKDNQEYTVNLKRDSMVNLLGLNLTEK